MLSTLLDKFFFQFCQSHPEVANCEANKNVMQEYAQDSGLMLDGFDAATFEYIFTQIPNRLALVAKPEVPEEAPPTVDELRQAENARLRGMTPHELHLEIRNAQKFVAPEIKLNYTALQIKQMEGRTLRALITYPNGQDRPGYRKAVDKILRGE